MKCYKNTGYSFPSISDAPTCVCTQEHRQSEHNLIVTQRKCAATTCHHNIKYKRTYSTRHLHAQVCALTHTASSSILLGVYC